MRYRIYIKNNYSNCYNKKFKNYKTKLYTGNTVSRNTSDSKCITQVGSD